MKKERRWKVVRGDGYFSYGDILSNTIDDGSDNCYFSNGVKTGATRLFRLVEIDEHGNTIRTYAKGDTLDGGTLVVQGEVGKTYRCTDKPLEVKAPEGGTFLEISEPENPGVFDDAPSWATFCVVSWHTEQDTGKAISKQYRRTVKTPAQRIAEELTDDTETQRLIVEGIERAGKLG